MDADDFLEGKVASTTSLTSKILRLPSFEKYIELERGIVICGYNIDTPGITLAGGRSGAQIGPGEKQDYFLESFRDCLKSMNLPLQSESYALHSIPIVDHGNVSTQKADPLTQARAQKSIQKLMAHCLKLNLNTIVIGGSNNSFVPLASSFLNKQSSMAKTVIKLDSSLDCDPTHPDNSVFQFLKTDLTQLQSVIFFGIQGRLVKQSELRRLKEQIPSKFQIKMLDKDIRTKELIKPYRTQAGAAFAELLESVQDAYLSVDLQVLNAAFFPGVGNPSVVGLSLDELCQILTMAGASGKIHLVDIAEFNPCTDKSKSGALLVKLILRLIGEWAKYKD